MFSYFRHYAFSITVSPVIEIWIWRKLLNLHWNNRFKRTSIPGKSKSPEWPPVAQRLGRCRCNRAAVLRRQTAGSASAWNDVDRVFRVASWSTSSPTVQGRRVRWPTGSRWRRRWRRWCGTARIRHESGKVIFDLAKRTVSFETWLFNFHNNKYFTKWKIKIETGKVS